MYLCNFCFKRLSMFSVQITMCFLPTLLFCALGTWGEALEIVQRHGWRVQLQGGVMDTPGPPQQRLWVWHWGEALSTAPLFSQGAGSGRAGGLWFPGAHPATLWTSSYRRKTTNKWRNCSSKETCQLCFKRFKISVSFSITKGWNALKRPCIHPSTALRYADSWDFLTDLFY